MIGRLITSDACVAEGAAWLANKDARLAEALAKTGPLPLRLTGDGFPALFKIIVGQQVSTASASILWNRLKAADLTSQSNVAAMSEEILRTHGLSRPKARYAFALAQCDLDYKALISQPNQQVIETLTKQLGIGQWSAEIYAMFSLGRADVFAHGDLALQESARVLFGLPARPNAAEMQAIAADWSPWRSVAARLLWAYYRVIKSREGLLT